MDTIRDRIDKSISNYSVSLMNNTKWKLVFEKVAELQLSFRVAFVREHKFGLSHELEGKYIEDKGIADGALVCGPVKYKEIYCVQIERFINVQNPETGATTKTDSQSNLLISYLNMCGMFPIEVTENYINIQGYGV